VSAVKIIISSSNNDYSYSYPELSLFAAFYVRSLGDKDRYYWESPILHTLTCLLFTCWHFKLMCAFYRERLNCIHSFCGERPDKKPVFTMPWEIKLFNCFTSSLLTGWPNVLRYNDELKWYESRQVDWKRFDKSGALIV
jgi:hypothetical protein